MGVRTTASANRRAADDFFWPSFDKKNREKGERPCAALFLAPPQLHNNTNKKTQQHELPPTQSVLQSNKTLVFSAQRWLLNHQLNYFYCFPHSTVSLPPKKRTVCLRALGIFAPFDSTASQQHKSFARHHQHSAAKEPQGKKRETRRPRRAFLNDGLASAALETPRCFFFKRIWPGAYRRRAFCKLYNTSSTPIVVVAHGRRSSSFSLSLSLSHLHNIDAQTRKKATIRSFSSSFSSHLYTSSKLCFPPKSHLPLTPLFLSPCK